MQHLLLWLCIIMGLNSNLLAVIKEINSHFLISNRGFFVVQGQCRLLWCRPIQMQHRPQQCRQGQEQQRLLESKFIQVQVALLQCRHIQEEHRLLLSFQVQMHLRPLWCRHVQMQHRPLQCRPIDMHLMPLWCWHLQEQHRPLQCRHVQVQLWCRYLQSSIGICSLDTSSCSSGSCVQTPPGAALASVVLACSGAAKDPVAIFQ